MAEKAKTLLAKLRFIEWLSTRHGELSGLQMAVSIRLVSLYNAKRGFAWPSLDGLAADLGVSRRTIVRVTNHLTDAQIFTKRKGGGRGHANEYVPRFDRVPDGDVYAAAVPESGTGVSRFSEPDGDQETGTSRAERVTRIVANRDRPVPPSEEDSIRRRINRSAAAASPDGDALAALKEISSENVPAALAQIERQLKAGLISDGDRRAVWCWLCEIADQYDGHQGDPVGGRAMRLADEVAMRL